MRTNFMSYRAILAIALLSGAAAASGSSIYQVTIDPSLTPDFYPAGESLVNFTSTEFNAATPPYAPQWGEIQITFTSTPAALLANHGNVGSTLSNMTIEMPQINNYGPVPIGDNLVPCDNVSDCAWFGQMIYVSALTFPDLTQDELQLQIQNGLNQDWIIDVYFAPGATAIGDATSVDVTYQDESTSTPQYTYYCGASSFTCSGVGTQITAPEPASLRLALAGLICLVAPRGIYRSQNRKTHVANAAPLGVTPRVRLLTHSQDRNFYRSTNVHQKLSNLSLLSRNYGSFTLVRSGRGKRRHHISGHDLPGLRHEQQLPTRRRHGQFHVK